MKFSIVAITLALFLGMTSAAPLVAPGKTSLPISTGMVVNITQRWQTSLPTRQAQRRTCLGLHVNPNPKAISGIGRSSIEMITPGLLPQYLSSVQMQWWFLMYCIVVVPLNAFRQYHSRKHAKLL
jgi:hypothetical protein